MAIRRRLEARQNAFAELQRELNQLFDAMIPRRLGLSYGLISRAMPPVNIYDDKDCLLVECELPGVDQNSLELHVSGDVLVLKGERPALRPAEGTTVHIQERGYGNFNRAITLPTPVEGDKAEARYDSGILTVKLPKTPQAKPKQVAVRAE